MFKYIFQDWKANQYSMKGRFIMVLFRIFSFLNKDKRLKIIFYPFIFIYKIIIEWVLCVEINLNATLGKNFRIFHGQGLVVNGTTIIGDDCLIRNNTTIGSKTLLDGTLTKAPSIGNNVEIGSNVVIIGAGSVVVKDIPNDVIIAGNPAKIIKMIK